MPSSPPPSRRCRTASSTPIPAWSASWRDSCVSLDNDETRGQWWTPIMTDLVASGIPYRDTFWNVPMWARVFVYVGGTAAVAVFAYGCWRRLALWLKGKPERRTDRIPERIALVLTQALGQARTLSQAYPGVMHAIVFWGFLALFIGTVLATIDYDITLPLLHVKLLKGNFYLLYELVLDMFGLFFVIGLGMACWRRFVQRPARIDPTPKFAYALLILFVINVTGFVMEACRLAVVKPAWAAWSPVGYVLGQGMLAAGLGEPALRGIHISLWLFHAAIAFIFIASFRGRTSCTSSPRPSTCSSPSSGPAASSPRSRTLRRRRTSGWASSRTSPGSGGSTSTPASSAGGARTPAPPTCRGAH